METQQKGTIESIKKLRIAVVAFELITPNQRTGGVSHFNHRLCTKLSDMGHEVTAITMNSLLEDANYNIKSLSKSVDINKRFQRYYLTALKGRKINFDGYDLVISNGDDWAMRRAGVPWVRIMHGSAIRELQHNHRLLRKMNLSILYLLERYSSKRSTVTLYNSKDTQKLYKNRKQDEVLHLPVDRDLFFPAEKEKEPTILFVGALDSRKRGRLLRNLYVSNIKKEIPNCKLWMVCNRDESIDGVTYFNNLTNEALASLYRKAHIFCMPSTYEGFGLPYLEAMASGTLVVTTPNPGADEILDNGKYGVIVKDSELGESLIASLRNINKYEMIIQRAIKFAEQQSWENIIAKYLTYLNLNNNYEEKQ
ncbi:glycosyltransferase family 4 protein [Paenibacillus lautus]|uniref:glycosyltransferase family 4 protein n=1 Tax=Paenibacillus lautus TaxID=1401 RepID=UPI003D2D5BDA